MDAQATIDLLRSWLDGDPAEQVETLAVLREALMPQEPVEPIVIPGVEHIATSIHLHYYCAKADGKLTVWCDCDPDGKILNIAPPYRQFLGKTISELVEWLNMQG